MLDENHNGTNTPLTYSPTAPILPNLAKWKVLVVEDEELAREFLQAHLTHWGLNAVTAGDGKEAMAILLDDPGIRLLITDLHMPGIDGLTLLKRIRDMGRTKLYCIVLSGIQNRQTLVNALSAGASDYLIKPCHPEQIFARLAVMDKLINLEENYETLIKDLFDVMGEMLGSRDNYTLVHSLRVAALSRRMGSLLGLNPEELNTLEIGCRIHDIGKIAIPDDILLKPGKFDNLDKKIMDMHPTIGARFIASRYPDDRITEIVLKHHERLDGSGYPAGIKGDEISLMVRIVSVADVYEALIAKRPYKKPISRDKALDILDKEVRLKRIDENVVKALEEVVAHWDPLCIEPRCYEDTSILESFREITYFREPLCSFYNYRYLLALDKQRDLGILGDEYHMFFIVIKGLRDMNQRLGFIKTDQILDELGESIQSELKKFCKGHNNCKGENIIFRKGTDYLLFVSYPRQVIGQIEDILTRQLDRYRQKWQLKATISCRSFPAECSLDKALNQFLEI